MGVKKNFRRKALVQLVVILAGLILINAVAASFVKRIDLTDDKRYSLAKGTKDMLKQLDDEVFFRVYLEGDFPAELKKFRNRVRNMLEEFRAYSGNKINYEFVDPAEGKTADEVQSFYKELNEAGLIERTYGSMEMDELSAKIVFPGAQIYYGETESSVMFVQRKLGELPDFEIYESEQLIEYRLASAIKKIAFKDRPKVAYLDGHEELAGPYVFGSAQVLFEFFDVERLNLRQRQWIPDDYAAVLMVQPQMPFNEQDKLKLDQYIMNGGKVFLCLDPLYVSLDSLQYKGSTIALPLDLRMDDFLFHYGVRVNNDLIQDKNCFKIPLGGNVDGVPQFQWYDWNYYPRIERFADHPITNGLNAIRMEYASSIDTTGDSTIDDGIKKTILMTSSRMSRLVYTPVDIQLANVRKQLRDDQYRNQPYHMPVAVLLEGNFSSIFKHRRGILEDILTDTLRMNGFKAEGEPSAIIVVSDGDMMKNQIDPSTGRPLPLGLYRDGQFLDNADFVLNSIEYLADDIGLMESRGKQFKDRLLDPIKVEENGTRWQLINILVPVVIMFLLGLGFYLIRIKRYAL